MIICLILNQIVNLIKPQSFLMIVLDGVCPIAKISNQIISRYVNNSFFQIDEFNELLKAINLEKINDFDGNQIFPGTDFMNKFEEYLNNYVLNRKKEDGKIWNDIEVLNSKV